MKQSSLKKAAAKLGSALVILFGVTFLTFLLAYLSPDDAAVVKLSSMGTGYTQETLEKTREEMGLDQPFLVQYGRWMSGVCRLDFGTSYRTNEKITDMMAGALPRTLELTLLSLAIMLAISIPLGIYCAAHAGGIVDRLLMLVSYLFCSLPSFFISLLVLYFCCIRMGWFRVMGETGIRGLIMPASVLGVTLASWYIRQIRAIAAEQLSSEYVRALRSRGVSGGRIMMKHVLKNCMVPLVTLLGVSFGSLLGGSAIVESIFSVNGVGSMAVTAVTARDYPFIQAYAAWMAALYLLVNFLVDLLYHRLDPRT